MQQRRILAAVALLVASMSAHAEHFSYQVSMTGIAAGGGTEGCFPPFDQPACPRPAYLHAVMSFDTPSNADGMYQIIGNVGDITDFYVNLGSMPTDDLVGSIEVTNGSPSGTVEAFDESEVFSFDWATRTVSYDYDFGYHAASGSFSGTLFAVPEPATALLMLAGLAGAAGVRRRRHKRPTDYRVRSR